MTSRFFHKIKLYILCLLGTVLALPIFIGGKLYAKSLFEQMYDPVYDEGIDINVGRRVNTVGNNFLEIIIRIIRLLLILTIALSVTMILYNGMMYIIQTGQGKEGKSLITNIALIVVGILVALFSVVAIRLIQSIPEALDEGLDSDTNHSIDRTAIKGNLEDDTGGTASNPE